MNPFLVDTNVISEMFKRVKHPSVIAWIEKQESLTLSVITIDEIFYGLHAISAWNHIHWFKTFLELKATVINVDMKTAEYAGALRGEFRKKGVQRTQADLLIAATAYFLNLTIVTRNEKDFFECKVPIYNPF